ncbi:hypothetical protein ACH4S8_03565 [Streptomyces sp. NPDC021080]|uniref:hypothetical protein n=1 Tax=Streptomyces sp. NPDC021080 TaxID=3365110 RepID=UPI003787FEAC
MRLHPVGDARTARCAVGRAVGPVAVVCAGVVVAGLGACALLGRGPVRAADPGGSDRPADGDRRAGPGRLRCPAQHAVRDGRLRRLRHHARGCRGHHAGGRLQSGP